MEQTSLAFAALADPVRLRALRVLLRGELAGGEVARVLGIAPSTTSKHLAALRDAGFVAERRDGRNVRVSVPASVRSDPRWSGVLERLPREPDAAGDLPRLRDVLRARDEASEGQRGRARRFVPGRSWTAWARALGVLAPPGLRVVDLGCGDGALTLEIARFAEHVTGIDVRDDLVVAARARARDAGVTNAVFVTGDLTDAVRHAASPGLAVLSHVLQQVDDPLAALHAVRALLAPGGRVLVLDLLPHRETWVAEHLGHRHLGFAPETLTAWLGTAGFGSVRTEPVAGAPGDPFRVVLATGVAPRAPRRARAGRAPESSPRKADRPR